jgi:hypothetical protein
VSKKRSPSSGGFRLLPENVVQLGSFRQRRSHSPSHTVFYLSETGSWLSLLNSFTCLQVEDITSPGALQAKLISRSPGLVIVEAELRWADPVSTIRHLESLLNVPIVMVCDAAHRESYAPLIKQAYAAGVYETLFGPLHREELFETLEVLLKFQSQVSLHQ